MVNTDFLTEFSAALVLQERYTYWQVYAWALMYARVLKLDSGQQNLALAAAREYFLTGA